ncbi:MAG: hypothetical protein DRI44_05725 [Chlamydiae bacterium]|nr:MAG: hypothetical protein DRI44_05725 [Chlamydiota bacterium]
MANRKPVLCPNCKHPEGLFEKVEVQDILDYKYNAQFPDIFEPVYYRRRTLWKCRNCKKEFDITQLVELTTEVEVLAMKLHKWYLEATELITPESYNPKAKKEYGELTESQRFIDLYIAEKILNEIKGKGGDNCEE